MAQTTTIEVNINWNKIYKEIGENFVEEFNWTFMEAFKGEITKYTPFLTGQLNNTAYVPRNNTKSGAEIVYPAVYASFVYNMIGANFTKDSHPQARAQWDKAVPNDTAQRLADATMRRLFDKYRGRIWWVLLIH